MRIDFGLSELAEGAGVAQETGWWLAGGVSSSACIAAYQAKGAASQAASYINLANPGTYNLTLGVAPAWDTTNGWTFDGTSMYLRTGVIPLYTWSILVRFAGLSGSDARMGASSYFVIAPRFYGSTFYQNGGGSLTVAGNFVDGVMGMAAKNAYLNDALVGVISAGTTNPDMEIYIGARNFVGSPNQPIAGKILAAGIWNVQLTGNQVSAVTNAMNAL